MSSRFVTSTSPIQITTSSTDHHFAYKSPLHLQPLSATLFMPRLLAHNACETYWIPQYRHEEINPRNFPTILVTSTAFFLIFVKGGGLPFVFIIYRPKKTGVVTNIVENFCVFTYHLYTVLDPTRLTYFKFAYTS